VVREDGSIIPLRIAEDWANAHVDTNCYFLLRGAFHTIARWALMPRPMAVYGDRVYLASLREEGLRTACTEQRTMNYLCTWAHLYREVGETPPAFAKDPLPVSGLPRWYAGLGARRACTGSTTRARSGSACTRCSPRGSSTGGPTTASGCPTTTWPARRRRSSTCSRMRTCTSSRWRSLRSARTATSATRAPRTT